MARGTRPQRLLAQLARAAPEGEDVVGVGGRPTPELLLAGYRAGLFAMGVGPGGQGPCAWYSPDPRGVLHPSGVHVSRSLRRSLRRYEVSVDRAFDDVVAACADPARPGAWIDTRYLVAYRSLHADGHAHSVECWRDGELAGGLFGISVGGLFAAESKFHAQRDASKAAVVALAGLMGADGRSGRLVDVQWCTPHLASLGAVEVPRRRYLDLLAQVLALPRPPAFAAPEAVAPAPR